MLRICVFVIVVTSACKLGEEPSHAPEDKPATEVTAKPATDTVGWTKRPTADCPAYPGRATVKLEDVDGGYTAAITTADASAVSDIRDDARYVEGASAAGAGAAALNFGGASGNRTTNCPIVLDGTTITVAEQPGGVILTVKAKAPATIDAIRKEARAKAATLAAMHDAMSQ